MAEYPITIDDDLPTEEQLSEALRRPERSLPPASDRNAWRRVAQRPWIQQWLAHLRQSAEQTADAGPGAARASHYLDYFRTGSRRAYHGGVHGRPAALAVLTAVECLEGEGRFMDTLLDLSWATAEETSWVMPAHLNHAGDEPLPDVKNPHFDLRTAMVARALAEMVHVLGERMDEVSPLWRKRIRFELERQAVAPYLAQSFHWENYTFNWNAVCTDGAVVAALVGGFDRRTKARVLAKALRSAPLFLSGFEDDGGCSEGPGYWRFGMEHFSSTAYHVHCATGGAVDLLADVRMPAIYSYPPKVVLSGSDVVNFADSPAQVRFRSGPIAWAAGQLGVRDMVALASDGTGHPGRLASVLDVLLLPEPLAFEPPAEAWLPSLQVLVARTSPDPDALVLAAKGGHNREHHNHNDVGGFIVHWAGQSLICDLGKGDYVKEFFGPKRYDFLVTRSYGHNVPRVNGCEQAAGRDFRAEQFELARQAGSVGVSMELKAAYPQQAGIESLRRQVELSRAAPGAVELTDEIEFVDEAGMYELPLYSEGSFEPATRGAALVKGAAGALRVEWDSELLLGRVEQVEHGDASLEQRYGPRLPRLVLKLRQPRARATVRIHFAPAE